MVAQIDFKYVKKRPFKLMSRLISYLLFEGRPVTTRGQWINPFVKTHLRTWKAISWSRSVKKPIFILGAGRSGTTILGVVMSMHKEIGFLNEPKALWHMIHPNEDVGGSYSKTDVKYRLTEKDVTADMRKIAGRLYGGFLTLTSSTRLVDKYPELSFRVPFVLDIFPDSKFIFLSRNGWDVCASIDTWSTNHGSEHGSERHDWWGVNKQKWKLLLNQIIEPDSYYSNCIDEIKSFTKHSDMAAIEWIATMREGLRLRKENTGNVHFIKYEDLVSNPEIEALKLQEFCELPRDKVFINYAKEALVQTKPYDSYEVHPAIKDKFLETLNELGYLR